MEEKQNEPVKEKKSLTGFAKGWTIFMIVYPFAVMASVLQHLSNPKVRGLVMLPIVFLVGMIVGSALMLKKKAYGYWILLASGILMTVISGASTGNYTLVSSGGLVLVFLSWLFTRKQIDYRFGSSKGSDAGRLPQINAEQPAEKSTSQISKAATSRPVPRNAEPNLQPQRQKLKINWLIAGGIAFFAVIIGVVLISMLWQSSAIGKAQYAGNIQTSAIPEQVIKTPRIQPKQEQAILSDIDSKFAAQILKQGQMINKDSLFLAALKNARYENPVFNDYSVTISVILPDPRAENLGKLGIPKYTPWSGAQAYIYENYAKLMQINTLSDTVRFEVNLGFLNSIGDEKKVDWSAFAFTGCLSDYWSVFKANTGEYMIRQGFYDAAKEILMPDFQNWPNHTGTEKDPDHLKSYFKALAGALAAEGMNYNGKLTVDEALIQELLEKRMTTAWAFDSLDIISDPLYTYFTISTFTHVAFFSNVYEKLDVQFRAGKATVPVSMETMEEIYLAAVQKKINDMYGELAKGNTDIVKVGSYQFDWEKLGRDGIAACPDLVLDIQSFMNAYDFGLIFLANTNGIYTN